MKIEELARLLLEQRVRRRARLGNPLAILAAAMPIAAHTATADSGSSDGSLHLVSSTYTLLSSFDIGSDTYRAAPGFTGDMFSIENATGVSLYSSTGFGVIDGNGTANGLESNKNTTSCTVYGITFQSAGDVHFYGGSRFTYSGGGNILRNCTFFATRVMFAGIGHTLQDLTFEQSVAQALRMGNGVLGSTDTVWSENSCNEVVITRITFSNCYTSGTTSTDDGVFYAGRRLCSDITCSYFTFTDCPRANCFYLDDGFSHVTASHFTFVRANRDFLIAGGVNIFLIDFQSTDARVASVWDDRFSIQNVTGGSYGSHYSNGAWHAMFQGGASHTHGALTCDANTGGGATTFTSEHTRVTGNAPLLARANVLFAAIWGTYEAFWSDEANYTTRGSVDYTRHGTTPAMTFNASSSTPPANVIVAGAAP